MFKRVIACCLVALAVPAAPASAQFEELTPTLTCSTYRPDQGLLVSSFGYVNDSDAPTVVSIGANNLFFPGQQYRGQPTNLLPGRHPDVFRTWFNVSASMPSITWFLGQRSATASNTPTMTPCTMVWAGEWQSGQLYFLRDVVTHAGSSWIAANDPGFDEPGVGDAWQPLGKETPGPRGPQGERGPAGPTGLAGRQGEPGPPGDRLTFPSSRTRRFPHSGQRRIEDPHVMPSSVIVIQYVGRAGRRPTAVAHVEAGSFVAKGSPGRQFDYVVFNGGA